MCLLLSATMLWRTTTVSLSCSRPSSRYLTVSSVPASPTSSRTWLTCWCTMTGQRSLTQQISAPLSRKHNQPWNKRKHQCTLLMIWRDAFWTCHSAECHSNQHKIRIFLEKLIKWIIILMMIFQNPQQVVRVEYSNISYILMKISWVWVTPQASDLKRVLFGQRLN